MTPHPDPLAHFGAKVYNPSACSQGCMGRGGHGWKLSLDEEAAALLRAAYREVGGDPRNVFNDIWEAADEDPALLEGFLALWRGRLEGVPDDGLGPTPEEVHASPMGRAAQRASNAVFPGLAWSETRSNLLGHVLLLTALDMLDSVLAEESANNPAAA